MPIWCYSLPSSLLVYEDSFALVVTGAYYYFMFTELKSILENVEEMGVNVPKFLSGKINFKIEEYNTDSDKSNKEENK